MSEEQALMWKLLRGCKRIAVVGCSDRPDRDSHRIFVFLKDEGYDVVPVNPSVTSVAGVPAVATLAAAGRVDLVNVFRAPEHLPAVVDDAIEVRAPAMWLQLGVVHAASIAKARAAGIEVVVDRCILIEHRRLMRE